MAMEGWRVMGLNDEWIFENTEEEEEDEKGRGRGGGKLSLCSLSPPAICVCSLQSRPRQKSWWDHVVEDTKQSEGY